MKYEKLTDLLVTKTEWTNLDFNVTLVAIWCNEFFKAEFAIESTFLFNKSNVLKRTSACSICAGEMIWAPDFTKCGNEWSSLKLGKKIINYFLNGLKYFSNKIMRSNGKKITTFFYLPLLWFGMLENIFKKCISDRYFILVHVWLFQIPFSIVFVMVLR